MSSWWPHYPEVKLIQYRLGLTRHTYSMQTCSVRHPLCTKRRRFPAICRCLPHQLVHSRHSSLHGSQPTFSISRVGEPSAYRLLAWLPISPTWASLNGAHHLPCEPEREQ